MPIEHLTTHNLSDTHAFFNDMIQDTIYQPLDAEAFQRAFLKSRDDVDIVTYVLEGPHAIEGFISGTVVKREKAYITFVLVDRNMRRRKKGQALLRRFEDTVKHTYPDVNEIDLIFFNPVLLPWTVPHTDGHDHPGAPGVDTCSGAYPFFQACGYRTFVTQNLYYKNIEDYALSDAIRTYMKRNGDRRVNVAFYDKEAHHGLDALCDNLDNDAWRGAIHDGLDNNHALLVSLDGTLVTGFTGPLFVQQSGRGYFAGIGVHNDYRGQGLGKILFANLCRELSGLGATFMTLFTGDNNPARRIYENEGFERVKTFANMRKAVSR